MLPMAVVVLSSLEVFKTWMWCLETLFTGGRGSFRLMVGMVILRAFFNLNDSMSPRLNDY